MTTLTATAPVAAGGRSQWSAVVAASLGIVLAALDMSIVAVALPSIGADLGAAPSTTQWIVLAYSLPLVALSIPAGRWLDRAGPLPAFQVAIGGFGVTSLLIAAAPNLGILLTGRALQGVFGSLIGVVGMPIVASSVRPEQRARAMSIILTLIPLSGVAAPALGGVLAEAYGWRSVFVINVPVVVVAAWFARSAIPARLPGRAGLPMPGARLAGEAFVIGAAAVAVFLVLGRLARSDDAISWPTLGLTAAGVLAFLAWTRLAESGPIRALLRRRGLAMPMIAMPMVTAGVGALNFLVPYFAADVLDATPRAIGATLLGLSAGMALLSPVAGVLADRVGSRPVTLAGAVVILAGTGSLVMLGGDASSLDVAVRLAVVGVGNGLFAGPNSAAVLAATPPDLIGAFSGVTALLRTLGFSLGPALGALAWSTAGGGASGFQAGILVLVGASAVAVAATIAGRETMSRPEERRP